MKKMLSILLSLVMVLGMLPTVWGADADIDSMAELNAAIAAANDGDTITLTGDITDATDIIVINKAITLDGADKTLTSTAKRAINVDSAGNVTIKNLTINASGERAINVIQKPVTLTIDKVTATAANYTVNVAGSAGAAKLSITNSTLTGLCTVNVAGVGAAVTVDNCTINCNDNNKTVGESYAALCLTSDAVNGTIVATNTTVNVTEDSDSTKGRNGALGGKVTINGSTDGVIVIVGTIKWANSDYYYGITTLTNETLELADANSTITLFRDVTLTESVTLPCPIQVNSEITFDLNGKNIAFDGDGFIIEEGGKLTINGEGNISAGNVIGCWVAVWAKGGDTVINGGNWSMAKLDENGEGNSLIYSKGGDITINDGYFNSENTFNNYGTPWYYVINRNNNYDGVIVVNGGTFENYDPSLSDDVLDEPPYLAEGYVSVAAADGKSYTVHKHTIEAVEAEEGDCLNDGVKAHYTCKVCGKLYSDAEGTTEVDAKDLAVAGGHKLTKVEAKEATYTEAGYVEHYICSVCKETFADAAGTTKINPMVPQLIKVEEVKAEVSEGAVDAAIEESKEADSVILDLTHKDVVGEENVDAVSQAQLPVASLGAVAAEDKPLTLVKEDAAVSFDKAALEAIVDQAEGDTVTLVVESVKVEDLEEEQQEAVEDKEVAIVISAELICDTTGKKLATETEKGFDGGKVAVAVPLPATLPEGTKAEDYKVYYVDDAGKVTEVESEVKDGIIVFVLEHFSKYVIAAEKAAGSPETADFSNLPLYSAMAIMAVLGMGVVVLKKKAF